MVSRKSVKIPLVSVLMPAYNAEKYIDKAIKSILNQTFTNFEFIILDDCSTDKTGEIIAKYKIKDRRIKTYKNEKNIYIAASRNILVKLANGRYIAWQDADDISLPTRIEEQYKFMQKHPDVGIVGGYLQFLNGEKNTSIRKYALNDRDLRKNIFKYSPVAQPAAMIKSKCFNELGVYNLDYPPAEDIDMSFRIGTKYKFANLGYPVIKYRESSNSATYKKVKFILATTLEIRRKYWGHYAYSPTFSDWVLNALQHVSLYFIPAPILIPMFNFIRNTR